MLIIGINPQDLTSDDLNKLKNEIRSFFEEGDGKAINVTSLYFQTMGKKLDIEINTADWWVGDG